MHRKPALAVASFILNIILAVAAVAALVAETRRDTAILYQRDAAQAKSEADYRAQANAALASWQKAVSDRDAVIAQMRLNGAGTDSEIGRANTAAFACFQQRNALRDLVQAQQLYQQQQGAIKITPEQGAQLASAVLRLLF
jgi:hypothetical protein